MSARGSDASKTRSLFQRRPAVLAGPNMAVAVLFVCNPGRPLARGAHQHYVAEVDRAFLLRDPTFHVLLRIFADGLLHHHHVLDQHRTLGRRYAQHAAFFALVAPADDPDLVVTTNVYDLVHLS